MKKASCKICRRLGTKLFLKGERCFTPKCAMVKRPYPPGFRGKRRKPPLSEYGKQLREKQKLRYIYNLEEKQFKNYVEEILKKRGKVKDAGEALIKILESRLDNVVYRLGFAVSRKQARQLVSHGHILVNEKPINIPSYLVQKGDCIKIKPTKIKKSFIKKLKQTLSKQTIPSWLELNVEKLEGKVQGEPTLAEAGLPVEISSIFEFYSR